MARPDTRGREAGHADHHQKIQSTSHPQKWIQNHQESGRTICWGLWTIFIFCCVFRGNGWAERNQIRMDSTHFFSTVPDKSLKWGLRLADFGRKLTQIHLIGKSTKAIALKWIRQNVEVCKQMLNSKKPPRCTQSFLEFRNWLFSLKGFCLPPAKMLHSNIARRSSFW